MLLLSSPAQRTYTRVASALIFPIMLMFDNLSGYFVNAASISVIIRWMQWVSLFRYACVSKHLPRLNMKIASFSTWEKREKEVFFQKALAICRLEAIMIVQWTGVDAIECDAATVKACLSNGEQVLNSRSFDAVFLTRDCP
jgi:hypothetical protein